MRLRSTVVLACALAVLAAGCDWPMFRNGPQHPGSSADGGISGGSVPSLVVDWTATTGGVVESSPAVANGVVYVGSGDRKLYAFDATTGAPRWTSVATGGSVFSSPAVSDGVVFVGSPDGKLYAFDAAGSGCSGTPVTCDPLWTATTPGLIEASPTVVGNTVYIASGNNDHRVYAFDAKGNTNCSGTPKTCTPKWTGVAGESVSSSPAVSGNVLYVGSQDGLLYAFDTTGNTNCTGTPAVCTPLWTSAQTAASVFSSPSVSGDKVYVGSNDDNLYAYSAGGTTNCTGTPLTCAPLWTASTTGPVGSSPAVVNGVVYVGSNDGKLYAFDATTGAPVWSSTTTGAPVFSSPAVVNGVVYVGSNNNRVYAFDASGTMKCSGTPKVCAPLWTATTGGSVVSSPAVANGIVYVGSDDHKLYAFELEKTAPTTSVVSPANNSALSGTVNLVASASDDVTVTSVQFHLTGGSFNDAVIGTATPTRFGWILSWDTKSLPDGAYTLTSVATDGAGNVGRSTGTAITVAN